MTLKGSVLVVEDDPINRIILTKSVTKAGYTCFSVENGEQALAFLNQQQIDIILLDLVMPGQLDGYGVLRELKKHPLWSYIPVIVVSELKDVGSIVECIKLGAADHLPKPIDPILLNARLSASLAQKRLWDAEQNHIQHLESYNTQLQSQNAELDAFAGTVAHDLKTPLTSIIGMSQLLEKYYDNIPAEQQKEYLGRIAANGARMKNIIDELLLLASIRKGEIQTYPLEMERIMPEVFGRLEHMVESYRPEIILPPQWQVGLGYGPWIEEVWANYMTNALKYGPEKPILQFGSDVLPDGLVRFWLKDNGQGIAPEHVQKLFIPFSRVNQNRVEGQGLGLSIVQRIVEKLDGKVGVESVLNEGSRFWFALPAV
jgi:signal transduction histidine kinase